MTNNSSVDTEYTILENIYDSGEQKSILRQRDLALKTGVSLGMTNAILRRLAQKGWITIKKLNSRNIQYAVTLDGINEIIHRSYNYFKRTIEMTVYYKEIINRIIRQAKQKNISAVILVGASDLDFIIEYACTCSGISFLKAAQPETMRIGNAETLKIYAETINYITDPLLNSVSPEKPGNTLYLSRLLMKQGIGIAKTKF